MVDALRRAHKILDRSGLVIDLHPSPSSAIVCVGHEESGIVDDSDGPRRHAAAGAALAAVVDERLFALERSLTFTFRTYSDSIEELRDYVAAHWRDGRINQETVDRTREALTRTRADRIYLRERIDGTRLRPIYDRST